MLLCKAVVNTIQHRYAVAFLSLAAINESSPEAQRRAQKTQVLPGMR
jgi:hypothetical protein